MKQLTIGILLFFSLQAMAQTNDDYLAALLLKQTAYETLSCSVGVHLEVPGVDIPDKQIYIELVKGEKPKIKAKGLLILPKKGLLGQFNNLINSKYQAIQLYNNNDTLVYKLVSLEKKSDWITADIYFTKNDSLLFKMDISTRKHGDFEISHFYDAKGFPKSTKIKFETSASKIPLKFLGRTHKTKQEDTLPDAGMGEIYLIYSNVIFGGSTKNQ